MSHHFFAMMSRMRYIDRWGLMRNADRENLSEHCLEVAMIAHALALIENKQFGGKINPSEAALYAIYHDATEIITGDLPTPVKYFNSELREAYAKAEESAEKRLVSMLPTYLQNEYEPLLSEGGGDEIKRIVKAADKLSALIKCINERRAGNLDFLIAEKSTRELLDKTDIGAVRVFMRDFIPSYDLTIDEQA